MFASLKRHFSGKLNKILEFNIEVAILRSKLHLRLWCRLNPSVWCVSAPRGRAPKRGRLISEKKHFNQHDHFQIKCYHYCDHRVCRAEVGKWVHEDGAHLEEQVVDSLIVVMTVTMMISIYMIGSVSQQVTLALFIDRYLRRWIRKFSFLFNFVV